MTDLKLVKKPRLILVSDGEENKSIAVIGYAFAGIIQFLFGLGIGWLVWG
ncbi:MAG: hypothetical protein KGI37_06555 [Alphaproteobacteria bacterium]|nr:hypothetical protein [Alphaproteobacteria bacterium]